MDLQSRLCVVYFQLWRRCPCLSFEPLSPEVPQEKSGFKKLYNVIAVSYIIAPLWLIFRDSFMIHKGFVGLKLLKKWDIKS